MKNVITAICLTTLYGCLTGHFTCVKEQKDLFTFSSENGGSERIFVWTGDFWIKSSDLTSGNPPNSPSVLTNQKGFGEASVIVLVDSYLTDSVLLALKDHKNVRTLVIHSRLVTTDGLRQIIDQCKTLESIRIDCPLVNLASIDFDGVKNCEFVLYEQDRSQIGRLPNESRLHLSPREFTNKN